ncbi:glycogen synthase GlgA [Phosphitispora sp. TUW77]|uniref:glycogen synthase GlgA n=1 Tax=Phosphitispora sp. TUW77 TaxID=3152361 RepID=UPI003AB7908C
MMLDRNLKVLLVGAEVVPFVKTGGLADVMGSLPKALTAMGNDARIILPRYQGIDNFSTVIDFPINIGGRKETCIVRQSHVEAKLPEGGIKRVPVYFIDNYHYFDREGIYCHFDDAERFGFFDIAVLEMLKQISFQPDVIHCNDWQSGMIPFLLREKYSRHDPFYSRIGTVFTVHNLLYQGNYSPEIMNILGIGDEYFNPNSLEFFGQASFMKGGLVYGDVINTVSKKYAQEIQTPEYGLGFEGLLRKRSQDLHGIVNGIDYHEFNPETDPRIFKTYNSRSVKDKYENKYSLQKEMDLPVKDVPVIGLVSRLVEQKGLNPISEIIDEMLKEDIQFVVLGEGDKYYEEMFAGFKDRYPHKIGLYIGYNGILAQRIYAGSDMFLMPSKFEPCGLGQLISLRYGTVPIVRATGGLADTIVDYDMKKDLGNGFSFEAYDPAILLETVNRALRLYRDYPDRWRKLVVSGMENDFSWNRSAAEYLELYDLAISKYTRGHRIA